MKTSHRDKPGTRKDFTKSGHKWALPLLILLLASFLRFWNLDAAEFKYDEARLCNLAAHFVDSGIPPTHGMSSSIGVDNPPLAVYLIAAPVLVSRDPLFITAFVALLNVIGIWGCYQLGRRFWSANVGLIAALMLATSPWAIFYSRKVWAQDLLLPFVVLFFYLLMAWFVDRQRWALGGSVIALAAMTQLHLATLAFVPMLLLLVGVSFRRREGRNWGPLLAGLGIGLALYAPYLISDALSGWRSARALVKVLSTSAHWRPEAMRFALLNVGGREIHALAGPERFREFLQGIVNLDYLPDRLEEMAVLGSMVYLSLRSEARRRDGLLLLWLITPPLFFLRSRTPVFPHYLIPLYPAPYLAIAAAVASLDRLAAHYWRVVLRASVAAALAVLITWQGYVSLQINAFVESHQTPGGMGTPIRIYREVTQVVQRLAREWNSRQVVVLCAGNDAAQQECPAVFTFVLGRALDVRLADRDESLLFPQSTTPVPVVLAPGDSVAGQELPNYASELVERRVYLREKAGAYRFFRLPTGYAPPPPYRPAGTPTRLANGVELLGYGITPPPSPGAKSRLALYWRVTAIPRDPPAQGYSFANHVLSDDGRRWGQKDGAGQPVALWRVGDTLVSYFDIEVAADAPPPPYYLRTGMYVFTPPDQFATVPVVDDNGRPSADGVRWLLPRPASTSSQWPPETGYCPACAFMPVVRGN